MRYFCKIILLFLFLSQLLSAEEVLRIRILSLSDVHAVLSPEAKYHLVDFARELKLKSDKETLVIDSGDLIQGSYAGAATLGKMVVEAVNLAGVDVWVPGNHDFEFGASVLSERMKEFKGAVLGANWRFVKSAGLAKVEPFKIFRLGQVSVAVIGLTEARERFRVLPGFPAEFDQSEEAALTRTLAEIHRRQADVIVLARHGSLYFRGGNLWKLLKKFPEIDLVLGGHTHEAHRGKRVGQSFFVQSPDRLEELVEVTIELDPKSRRVLRIVSRLQPLVRQPQVMADTPELLDLQRRAQKLAEKGRAVLPGAPFHGIPGEWAVAAMEEFEPGGVALFGAEVAQQQQASFSTLEELFQLFPYENEICIIRVSSGELATIIAEQRQIGSGRRMALFHSPLPSEDKEVLLVTTDYILSGAGGIAPATRAIAEKNRKTLRQSSIPLRDGVLQVILNKPR